MSLKENEQGPLLQELHWACGRDGDKERMQKLIYAGANPGMWLSGWNAVHSAARFNRIEIVILLLARPSLLDSRTAWGHTALIICAQCNHIELARILILRGADWFATTNLCAGIALSAENDWGSIAVPRPSDMAIQEAVGTLKSAFLARQASAASLSEALCSACGGKGSKRDVVALLDQGADAGYYFEGWCPLHFAAMAGSMPILQQLLEYGVSIDALTLLPHGGLTALHIAAMYGRQGVCQLLLEKGADLRILNAQGRSAVQEYGTKLSTPRALKAQFKGQDLEAFFVAGPHPSQVQRRRDEMWAQKEGVIVANQPSIMELWSNTEIRKNINTFL